MIQDYDAAIQNAVASLNARMRTACTAVGTRLSVSIAWAPDGKRPTAPVYPLVSAQFLRLGTYIAGQQRLRSDLQFDVFTTGYNPALARKIAGGLLTELGISLGNHRQFCEIAQTDTASGLAIPLLPMELEIGRGWETLPDPDPSVTHLFLEPILYHQ